MGRGIHALDRAATTFAALLLVAVGALALAWWSDRFSWLSASTDTGPVEDLVDEPWWPWALGGAGVLLVVLGLRWIAAHLPDRSVSHLALPGSTAGGRLLVDAAAAAGAAADDLASTAGVRSTRGSVRRDRGQLVAVLDATVEPETNLAALAASADRVSDDLARVLGRGDVHCRVMVRVARKGRALRRVR